MVENPDSISAVGTPIRINGGNVQRLSEVFTYMQPAQMSGDAKLLMDEMLNTTRDLANAGEAALGNIDPTKASGAAIVAVKDAQAIPLNEQKAALTAETENKAQQIVSLSQTLTATENSLTATTDELAAAQSNLADSQSVLVSMLSQNALAEGFGGMVKVSAVVNTQGTIAYLTIDASCETPEIGQKVMETEYLVQFLGKTLPLTLGADVDAATGATATSQAVVDAVNNIIR